MASRPQRVTIGKAEDGDPAQVPAVGDLVGAAGRTCTGSLLYRRLLREMRPYWRHIGALFALSLLSSLFALLTPVPLKIAVDSVAGSRPLPGFLAIVVPAGVRQSQTGVLLVAALLFVLLSVLKQLQQFGNLVLATYTGEKLLLQFRSRLFRHVERLSLAYHDSRGTADLAYRIQYDATAIQTIAVSGLIPLFAAIVTVAGMVYVIASIDWQLALVSLTVAPVLFGEMRVYRKRLRAQWHDAKRLESSALSVVQESLAALRVVKAFGQEDRARDRFADRSAASVRAKISLAYVEGSFGILVGGTVGLGMGIVLFLGTRSVLAGTMTLGELVLVVGYLQQLYDPLKTASKKAGALQSSLASAERVYSVFDEAPDFVDPPQARPLARAHGAVTFENVSFGYEPRHRVLRDISFELPPGKRLGIAGATGAGKTTLMSLLTRFYDPSSGRILLDGADLRDYRLADVRSQFAIVLQEPVLFSTSIAENIAYGCPGASRADVIAAATAASANDFICALPDGYATPVGERGARLSGGERQRIALARAFLKDAPILILDEPTSSVDAETEADILGAMERLMSGRTALMIAHRASTLEICDSVLELEHGHVVSMMPSTAARAPRGRKHAPVPCRVDHPVVRAWEAIASAGAGLERVERLRVHKRPQIYRLTLADGTTVIAKRGQRDALLRERTIYDSVLPRLPVPALRNLGFVGDRHGDAAWLFIEDAGDDPCCLEQHRRLAARWLGTLHGATADLDAARLLPARGPAQFLEHLRAARRTILDNFDNPALGAEDRGMLGELVSVCNLIESSWTGIEAICAKLPRTLVHGDVVGRNLRLISTDAGPAIVAFDWEWAGFGVPATDVYQLAVGATREDVGRYRATISEYVGALEDDELRMLLLLGNGFWLLAAVDWASAYLPHRWPEKGVATLHLYEQPLWTWVSDLRSAA